MTSLMKPLANLSATYRQSLLASDAAGVTDASTTGGLPLPPFTEIMTTLQRLRESDPTLYHRVKQEMVTSLQTAAHKADAAFDIRKLGTRRRAVWMHSVASSLNQFAYILFPGFGEPITRRDRL